MKYSVITFGCRVNQADSLGFEEDFLARGAEAVRPEDAEVVVVNTCSVTASADQAARQAIRRVARVNPAARIVVTGCYATRRPEDVQSLPNVVGVVPNDDKPHLVSLLRGVRLRPDLSRDDGSVRLQPGELDGRRVRVQPDLSEGEAFAEAGQRDLSTADRFADGAGSCGAAIEPGVAGRTAFTLRVQTGCAEPCSYCIIPTTRGAPRSVAIDELIGEVDRVAAAGFKEIALTGVHLGSYGRDLTPRASLIDLLRALDARREARSGQPPPRLRRSAEALAQAEDHAVQQNPSDIRREGAFSEDERARPSMHAGLGEDIGRARPSGHDDLLFRISSLEPMDCTPEIVDLVATSPAFAPHFHLPLQHASNAVLRAMRRPYTIEYFAALVDTIRSRIPYASIGSDVIVGFPGETDAAFDSLASYLERSPLTHLHVFPYSDRPGTPAAAMPGRAAGTVVRERARRLREISERLSRNFRDSQVGTVHRGLTIDDGSQVVTGNYLKVRIPPGRSRNEWIKVKILEAGTPLTGHPVAG